MAVFHTRLFTYNEQYVPHSNSQPYIGTGESR
nr:MAG TPA: hypothetical protein [Caudoviricetes sp.]